MNLYAAGLAGTLLLAAGGGASAQEPATPSTCVRARAHEARDAGWRLRMEDADKLKEGQVISYTVSLSAGLDYMLFACGDGTATDLDIYLFDSAGALVAHDDTESQTPSLVYKATRSGEYIVQIKAYGFSKKTEYALDIMYKWL